MSGVEGDASPIRDGASDTKGRDVHRLLLKFGYVEKTLKELEDKLIQVAAYPTRDAVKLLLTDMEVRGENEAVAKMYAQCRKCKEDVSEDLIGAISVPGEVLLCRVSEYRIQAVTAALHILKINPPAPFVDLLIAEDGTLAFILMAVFDVDTAACLLCCANSDTFVITVLTQTILNTRTLIHLFKKEVRGYKTGTLQVSCRLSLSWMLLNKQHLILIHGC